MPTLTSCPSCSRQLRVPDELLGKQVKCPSCSTTFTATAAEPPAAPPVLEIAVTPTPPGPMPGPPPLPIPPQLRGRDFEFASERDRTNPAADGPALALMITSGMAMALAIFGLFGNVLLGGLGMAEGRQAGGGRAAGPDPVVSMVSGVVGAVIGLVIYGVVFAAAWNMKQRKNWGFALAGSIIALLPCSMCCVLTMPFGIWSIVVLANEDVKASFVS